MATNWAFYDDGILAIGDGTDLSSTTAGRYKLALMQGPSGGSPYTPDPLNHRYWDEVSASEIAAVDNGYTLGGVSLTGVVLSEVTGDVKWTVDSPITFTQAGANSLGPTQYAIIRDTVNDGGQNGTLICWTQFSSEADLTNGTSFSLIIPTTGILTIQRA